MRARRGQQVRHDLVRADDLDAVRLDAARDRPQQAVVAAASAAAPAAVNAGAASVELQVAPAAADALMPPASTTCVTPAALQQRHEAGEVLERCMVS